MNEPHQPNNHSANSDLIGRRIGHYEILHELGRGGMATVYLAQQINMSRQVAIKVLPREFLHDPQFIERFEREVNLIVELEHPHILPVYDFGEIEGIPFIVMRYLGGGSLRDFLDQGLPPYGQLERPLAQVCSALDFAHAEGIIHRDIKPSNILLDSRGNAYLSDFGIARILQDAGRLTGSAVIGTPAYMSPEQAEGRPLDARSDVYAMGVVLFEMLTGREPFQADTPMAMLLKQITEPMPSPRAYRPDLPKAIEQVVLRATLKDVAGRYPSAGELAGAFRWALSTLSPDQTATRTPLLDDSDATVMAGPRVTADSAVDLVEHDASPTVVAAPEVEVRAPTPPRRVAQPASRMRTEPVPEVPPQRRRWGLWLGVVGLLLLLVVVVGIVPRILPSDAATPVPPTPFAGASIFSGTEGVVQIAVPDDWTRQNLTEENRPGVLFAAPDGDAFFAAHVIQMNPAADVSAADIITRFDAEHFSDARLFTRIDGAEQPDGGRRISYRLPQPDAIHGSFGQGQLDAFFYRRGRFLIALEVFTADRANVDTLLPLLQNIMNSVYFTAAPAG